MAHIYNTTIRAEYQGFICEKIEKDGNGKNFLLQFELFIKVWYNDPVHIKNNVIEHTRKGANHGIQNTG